jgi:isoquinoline 1-oxidoreductase subunit alpha
MINLTVNGETHRWDGDPSLPLLWYLRDESGLLGTKYGCGQALCGSCTVHVGGQAVRACITAMADVADQQVVTIEGQTGQIMQAAMLLKDNPRPTDQQIREQMAGNICRCGCYTRIEAAIRLASTGV